MADDTSFPTRRDLMKWLSSGIGAASVSPLAAQNPKTRPAASGGGFHADDPPVKIWDVPAPQTSSGGVGESVFLNGQIAYSASTFGGKLVLQDVQTGASSFSSPAYLFVGNPAAVGSQIYVIIGRVLQGFFLQRYDPSTQTLTTVYTPNNLALLGTNGRYLYFVENKQNLNYLACFDPVTEQIVFSSYSDTMVSAGSPPVAADNVIVYGMIDRLIAVDPTGQILWTFQHPQNDSNVLYTLAAADGNVFFTVGNTLYAVDLTDGTLAWEWTGASALGNPVAYGGVVFVGDAAGNFNAIQSAAGGAVAPGKAAWPALPAGGNLTGPIFIEDGIAYFANTVLNAVDLSTSPPRMITYALSGPVSVLNGVENGVAYLSYSSNSRVAAVDIGHQLHEFFCDSQLMAEDYTAAPDQAAGYQPANPSYRTHVRLLDPNGNPRVNKSVKVWASDSVTITSGRDTFTLGPAASAWLSTDSAGEIEIVSTATDISTPALYVWGTFMDPGEAIVIYPDHRSLTSLAGVQGSALAQAKAFDGSDLLADKSGSEALASIVRNTLGGVAQSVERTRTERAGSPGPRTARRLQGVPAVDTYIAFPGSTPNMLYQATAGSTDRVYIRGSLPNWTAGIVPGGSVIFGPGSPAPALIEATSLDFGAFLQNVARGARAVVLIVANTTDAVYHTITDDLGFVYHFAIDTVEKAIAVVSAVLKTIVKDVLKAVEWLSWLFNWSDILDTKNQIKSALTANVGKLKDWLAVQQSDFGSLHNLVQTLTASNGGDTAAKAVSGVTFQSVQVQGNNPQVAWGAGGAQAFTPSKALLSKVTLNAGQGSVTTLLTSGITDDIVNAAQTFLQTIEAKLASDFASLGGDLEKIAGDFTLLMTDPGEFVKHGIADLIQLIKDVGKTFLDLVDAVIESFISGLTQILDGILSLAATPIQIPVVSDLWRVISRDSLTVLDVCALLAAVPVTLVEKALSGLGAETLPGAAPPLNRNIAFVFAASFSLVFDALNDLFDFPDTGTEAYIIFGLGLLTQGMNFPDDEIGNPDNAQIFLYAVSWFPVALSAFLFAASKSNPALKKKVSDGLPVIYFAYGCLQVILATWIGVFDPEYAGPKNLGMIAGIFAGIPLLAKVEATGEALSARRIAVSTIDGVFEATSLGLTAASW